MANKNKIEVTVNGVSRTAEVEPRLLLVHYLRDVLGLTGTHIGCETSLCGACTVMVDGAAVKSCTLLAVQADGCEVRTIESLATDEGLHPIQEAFWECHGLQCGFCTPGFVVAAKSFLDQNPSPSHEEIKEGLAGNICRCGTYPFIFEAVKTASRKMGG